MIVLNTLQEMKPYYSRKLKTYIFNSDVQFTFDLKTKASIQAWDIQALNINALNIQALDIQAQHINCLNLSTSDIKAINIVACNINSLNIEAKDIKAKTINAESIIAQNIIYDTLCEAYAGISCYNISGLSLNAKHHVKYGKIKLLTEIS